MNAQNGTANWPRGDRGRFLKHVGFPKGLNAWFVSNEGTIRREVQYGVDLLGRDNGMQEYCAYNARR